MLEEALALAQTGQPVFPCGHDKRPLVNGGFHSATTDESVIREWWERWPAALVGAPTGNGWIAIDVDEKKGAHGHLDLEHLEQEHGPLPLTVTKRTPSAGSHLLYKVNRAIACSTKKVAPGIDIRGDGGYIIAVGPGWSLVETGVEEMAPLPEHWYPVIAPVRASGNGSTFTGELPSRQELDSALLSCRYTDEMGREEWLRLLMAYKVGGGDRVIAHAWCQQQDGYTGLKDFERDWASIEVDRDGGVGPGTLFRLARSFGWRAPSTPHIKSRASADDELADDKGEEGSDIHTPPSFESMEITDEELEAAQLAPACIVEDHTYADVAVLAAPGGTGKTTLLLHEAACMAVSRPVWGHPVHRPGWTLFITGEDARERLVARMRCIVAGMDDWSAEEKKEAIAGLRIWDVTGQGRQLVRADNGNIDKTALAGMICDAYHSHPPNVILIDPLVSFGADESKVNTNEQRLIDAAREIVQGLDCCVRYVHHTGQQAARERITDQYAGRGGSALSDGARMVSVLHRWHPEMKDRPPPSMGVTNDGGSVLALARPKLTYSEPNLPPIWIKRDGWQYDSAVHQYASAATQQSAHEAQILRWLMSQAKKNRYYTQSQIERAKLYHTEMGMGRDQFRAALVELEMSGRVSTHERKTGLSGRIGKILVVMISDSEH